MDAVAVGALVVIAVMLVLWTVLLIPALLEVRRAAWRVQELIRTLEIELKPVLSDARETLRTAARAAGDVADGTARLRGTLGALEKAGDNVRATTDTVRAVFGSRLIPVAVLLAGMRGGGKYLWRHLTRRREQS
jgi:uncharacterized protein YoxC